MLLDTAKEWLICYTQLTDETVNARDENNEGNISNKDGDFDEYEQAVLQEEERMKLE